METLQQEITLLQQQLQQKQRQLDLTSLSLDEYKRYGRQMIVPHFGSRQAQLQLKQSSILVVGAGGLGCPALMYLVAAGVGRVGIIDPDTVDVSNLHRQVLHTQTGVLKVDSARNYLEKLNPHVQIETYPSHLDKSNAFEIMPKYNVVLDCTDHPAIRYLVNDVAVLLCKTVVSGSGIRTDGQVCVLNLQHPIRGPCGPCYRCFYPQPPSEVTSCSDGGVLGPVIGLIGTSMAVETIKVLTGHYDEDFKPFLLQYSGYPEQQMRRFRMRGKQQSCVACGENANMSEDQVKSHDYGAFCKPPVLAPLESQYRMSATELGDNAAPYIIDVRPKEQFRIAALPNSTNIPWDDFKKLDDLTTVLRKVQPDTELIFVCRYGNDSQLAVKKALEMGYKNARDVIGGLDKWSNVDTSFPRY